MFDNFVTFEEELRMFNVSVRRSYTGQKPVTSWFKYHVKSHGWVEGVDFVYGTSGRVVDWLLTNAAAAQSGLGVRHVPVCAGGVAQLERKGLDYVYLVEFEGIYKIGMSSSLGDRVHALGGNLVYACLVDGAYAAEQAVHAKFREFRLEGEWYSPTLPVQAVKLFMWEVSKPTT